TNDVQAAGAVTQAYAMGLEVPGDISITGFDDISLARATHPPLTTIQVPHKAMGTQAAQMVLDLLSDQPIQSSVLDAPLVIRDTTGPVASYFI
ncbi:MAG: substrate-binding domain-containing protein, partial [Pseudomonadota bacterium]